LGPFGAGRRTFDPAAGLPSELVIHTLMVDVGLDHYDAVLATCAAIPRAHHTAHEVTASMTSDGRIFRR
jgi:hypothetical protein